MPYASNTDLPEGVKGLPVAGQTMWRKVFNNSHAKYGEKRAIAIAWGAVKRVYKKVGDRWAPKGETAKTLAGSVFGTLQKMLGGVRDGR